MKFLAARGSASIIGAPTTRPKATVSPCNAEALPCTVMFCVIPVTFIGIDTRMVSVSGTCTDIESAWE